MVRHPFEATLARAGRSLPEIAEWGPRLAAPRDWPTLGDLAGSAQLDHRLELISLRQMCGRRDVAAVRLLETLLKLVATPTVAALLLDRRLLDLDPRALAFRFGDDGSPAEWAVAAPRFRAVGDDAERAHPDVLATAGDVGKLLPVFRAQLEDGFGPLVDGLHLLGRRSRTALWRGCSDVLGSAFLSAGNALGVVHRAVALGERCLALAGPLRAPGNYRALTLRDGSRAVVRVRRGCCLHHAIEPGQTCPSCPLTSDAERRRRLELDTLTP